MTTTPEPGTVIFYDDVPPPFPAGSYRITSTTSVNVGGDINQLTDERFFEVESPRFSLPPSEIATLYPPRNGHGGFHLSLPQITLRRRTLPWERELDPRGRIPTPTRAPGEVAPRGRTPWMALLLFDEGEATFFESLPLEGIVPSDVFQRLGSPAGVRCEAVEVERGLLKNLLPSLDELRLLVHARQVETENRSLDAGDGWFAVVTANRLPRPGARHVACLVSLEERSDLVVANPPPLSPGGFLGEFAGLDLVASAAIASPRPPKRRPSATIRFPPTGPATPRLVVLTSWRFEGGDATFGELVGSLDAGLFGARTDAGEPPVTDTGHLPMTLEDRDGQTQTVWYRSPLVPHELARDTLGPYHSADQARRMAPETGAEDITYAAAFEVGRLLAVADGRTTSDTLRWRRAAYRSSARESSLARTAAAMTMDPALTAMLAQAPAPVLSVAALERAAGASLPRVNVTVPAAGVVGLDPAALADAWTLPSRASAEALLSARPVGSAPVSPPLRPPSPPRAPDTAAVAALGDARDRLLDPRPPTPRSPR